MKKILAALLLTLPTLAFAVDLEGYYITAKGGVSKSMDTGTMSYFIAGGETEALNNEDLGTGSAFGISAGKYITDNIRLELEVIKRTSYELDTTLESNNTTTMKGSVISNSIFINGFYDFQPFSISNTAITPYLGGGLGISRNKMGTLTETGGNIVTLDSNTINQFAYKVSAGTLVSLTDNLCLDINYQYVNLGSIKSGVNANDGGMLSTLDKRLNEGEIESQEIMFGLRYKFN
jgi:opacity protein-like surface antigen|tara:strand:+ start:157 stop:858 length:702 start_codon:yes stop_codon:yes gene_type:complete